MHSRGKDERRLRVMTLVDYAEGGGAERAAVGLAMAIDRERFDSMVCATRAKDGDVLRELAKAGVRVIRLERKPGKTSLGWGPLVRTLRRERVDVLHAHKYSSNVWGVLVGRLARVPVIIATEHSWSFTGKPVRKLLDRFLVGPFASAFVAVSHHDARKMTEVEGVHPRKVWVIHNGVVPRAAHATAEADPGMRAELGIPAGAPVIGTACALRREKALEVLVEAFATVRAELPDARLLIAGAGQGEAERLRLEAEAGRLGLALGDSVIFLGRREDIDRFLDALDVFVLSSDNEGMPLAMLEAMGAGRAVVATSVGGVPEVAEGEAAVLVPPRDPASMAREVLALLASPRRRAELGERGRRRVDAEFSYQGSVERWQSLYGVLYERSRASRRRHAA